MGSAILAYPTLRRTAEVFPGVETHFLIFRRNVESVEILGLLNPEHIHVIDDRNLVRFALSSLLTLLRLRRARFDVVIDLELFSRCTALMSFFIAAPIRVGFHKYTEEGLYRGSFLTHRVAYNPHFHISRNFAALLKAASQSAAEEPLVKAPIPTESELPRLSVDAECERARGSIRALYSDFDGHTRLVLLNPDPGLLALRGWPVESYRTLTQRLLDHDPNVIVGIIGLKRSSHFHSAIAAGASEPTRIINLCGVTASMRELLGVFSLSAVLVSNDSGPGHFAPLVGLSSVVLFGPESPHRYAPLGPDCTPLFANFACSPCFSAQNHRQSVCRNNRCLQAISVDEVFSATVRALASERVKK
jgi:ADP-heptose:LPS heptosyltransferase